MKYGLLCYDYLENLGNEIQSIAARRFLPEIDYFIDYNNLSTFKASDDFKMIMNAWYFHETKSWPPVDEFIHPLLISMHININNKNVLNHFLTEESRDFLVKYGPVGTRDHLTRDFLLENDIPAYFSGCLTLTLEGDNSVKKEDYILLVDVPKELIGFIKSKTDKKVYVLSHNPPMDLNKRRLSPEFHYLEDRIYNSQEKFFFAECLLNLYERASCVITKRLHVALPCLAFNTPVLVINDEIINGERRFSSYKDLLNFYSLEEYMNNYTIFDVNNPPQNKKDYLKIRKELISTVKKFTGHINPSYHSFKLDSFDFMKFNTVFLSKINNSLNETNQRVFNLENRIKELEAENINQKNIINEMASSNSWKLTKPLRNIMNFRK